MTLRALPLHDEVHVWTVDLADARWDSFFQALSGDEREKALRFRTSALQHDFQRCRTALRQVLASYTHSQPRNIRFSYGEFGKPHAVDFPAHFNLSHSRGKALVAVSLHAVGIDLEYRDEEIELAGLIDMVCHPNEQAALAGLSEEDRRASFYRLWTQKEAYCKATGTGLQNDLHRLCFIPCTDADVLKVQNDAMENGREFYVQELHLPAGYGGSVCTTVPGVRLSFLTAEQVFFPRNVPAFQM